MRCFSLRLCCGERLNDFPRKNRHFEWRGQRSFWGNHGMPSIPWFRKGQRSKHPDQFRLEFLVVYLPPKRVVCHRPKNLLSDKKKSPIFFHRSLIVVFSHQPFVTCIYIYVYDFLSSLSSVCNLRTQQEVYTCTLIYVIWYVQYHQILNAAQSACLPIQSLLCAIFWPIEITLETNLRGTPRRTAAKFRWPSSPIRGTSSSTCPAATPQAWTSWEVSEALNMGEHMGRSMAMGVSQTGWFIRQNLIKMDDDWGYPYFRKPPYWENDELKSVVSWGKMMRHFRPTWTETKTTMWKTSSEESWRVEI